MYLLFVCKVIDFVNLYSYKGENRSWMTYIFKKEFSLVKYVDKICGNNSLKIIWFLSFYYLLFDFQNQEN